MKYKKLNKNWIYSKKINVYFILFYILVISNFLNIGNYSFLSYTFSGISIDNSILSLIKFSRLPIIIISCLIVAKKLSGHPYLVNFFKRNLDLFLFIVVCFLGTINASDKIYAIFYSMWQAGCLVLILFYLFSLFQLTDRKNWISKFLNLLFFSNLITLVLLCLNMYTLGDDVKYYMAFTSKTFSAYCIFTMLTSLYIYQINYRKSLINLSFKKLNPYLNFFTICLIIFFSILSARRSVIFSIVFTSFIYLYYIIGKNLWKKIAIIIISTLGLIISIPKVLEFADRNHQQFAVLRKITDFDKNISGKAADPSLGERLIIWSYYLELSEDYPIVGTGAYNGEIKLQEKFGFNHYTNFSTHNTFITILVEHGYLGIFLFFIIIIKSTFIILLKFDPKIKLPYLAILVIPTIIINSFEFNFYPGQTYYWATMLILLYPRIYLAKSLNYVSCPTT